MIERPKLRQQRSVVCGDVLLDVLGSFENAVLLLQQHLKVSPPQMPFKPHEELRGILFKIAVVVGAQTHRIVHRPADAVVAPPVDVGALNALIAALERFAAKFAAKISPSPYTVGEVPVTGLTL